MKLNKIKKLTSESIVKCGEKHEISKELGLLIDFLDFFMETIWTPNWRNRNADDISKCFDCSSFLKDPTIVFEFKRTLDLQSSLR